MKRILLASAIALTVAAAPGVLTNANAAPTFSALDAAVNALGDEIGSPFDKFLITGKTGQWDTAQETIAILTLIVGGNCHSCDAKPVGQLGFFLTVGSVTQTANVGWAWWSNGPVDSLAVTAPSALTYVQSDGEVDVAFFAVTSTLLSGDTSNNGVSNVGVLTASVDVPEPASIALLGAGLLGIGMLRGKAGRSTGA